MRGPRPSEPARLCLANLATVRHAEDTQLCTPEQEESDLLFPAVNGKFRSPCVLSEPLDEVAADVNIGKKISQRPLRRTFNDLARDAQVNDLFTRSISGHLFVPLRCVRCEGRA